MLTMTFRLVTILRLPAGALLTFTPLESQFQFQCRLFPGQADDVGVLSAHQFGLLRKPVFLFLELRLKELYLFAEQMKLVAISLGLGYPGIRLAVHPPFDALETAQCRYDRDDHFPIHSASKIAE